MELHNAFDNKTIDQAMMVSKSFVKKKKTCETGSMVYNDNRCIMQRYAKKGQKVSIRLSVKIP